MVFDVTEENFQAEVMESELPVLIDFWADWCGPCHRLAPVFEEVSEKYEGRVRFARVETTAQKGLRIKFAIGVLPTLTLCRGEKIIDIADRLVPAEELERRLDIALTGALDDQLCRKLIG